MEGNEALKLEQTRLPLEQWDRADATARIRGGSWDNPRVWGSINQLTTSPETRLILYVATSVGNKLRTTQHGLLDIVCTDR